MKILLFRAALVAWLVSAASLSPYARAAGPDADLAKADRVKIGQQAPVFEVTTLDGQKFSLKEQQGKVVVLDFFATWCGPCLAEMPHFDEMKEKYRDNPQVAFVSLSIDDGAELWKNNVEKRNAGGIQWLINRNKLDAYNIVGIPRTLLIDKNFKIVDMNGPVPSSKDLPSVIDNLLK